MVTSCGDAPPRPHKRPPRGPPKAPAHQRHRGADAGADRGVQDGLDHLRVRLPSGHRLHGRLPCGEGAGWILGRSPTDAASIRAWAHPGPLRGSGPLRDLIRFRGRGPSSSIRNLIGSGSGRAHVAQAACASPPGQRSHGPPRDWKHAVPPDRRRRRRPKWKAVSGAAARSAEAPTQGLAPSNRSASPSYPRQIRGGACPMAVARWPREARPSHSPAWAWSCGRALQLRSLPRRAQGRATKPSAWVTQNYHHHKRTNICATPAEHRKHNQHNASGLPNGPQHSTSAIPELYQRSTSAVTALDLI